MFAFSNIQKAHKKLINVAQLLLQRKSLISQKLAMSKSEGNSGVESGSILKIGVQLSDILKAHKYPVN